MAEGQQLLHIAPFHMGKARAREYVEYLAGRIGTPIPGHADYGKDVCVQLSGKEYRLNFARCVQETQEGGTPSSLQFIVDSQDRYLAPAIEIMIPSLPKGLNINLSGTVGQFTNQVQAPGRIECPEQSIAEDTLYYRRECCLASTPELMRKCTRCYRSYLQSCISLIDCFLFRYARSAREKISEHMEAPILDTLESKAGIENRILAWIRLFAPREESNYDKTTEWSQFQEIRRLRNYVIHPLEPVTAYSFSLMAAHLNLCRKGIGGFLHRLRIYSGEDPRLGFIQKISTAPEVKFIPA